MEPTVTMSLKEYEELKQRLVRSNEEMTFFIKAFEKVTGKSREWLADEFYRIERLENEQNLQIYWANRK